MWGKNHKRVPPPPPSLFYEVLFFSLDKGAYDVIFATEVRVCYDFCDKRTLMLRFLRQKCILCVFWDKKAHMLWFSQQQLCFWYFCFKLQFFPGFSAHTYTIHWILPTETVNKGIFSFLRKKKVLWNPIASHKIPFFFKRWLPL